MRRTIFNVIVAFLIFSMHVTVHSNTCISQDINTESIPDAYTIINVPYVSQETSFYCIYACPTMSIKYFLTDTTLQEVLFNSGNGYSLIYSHRSYKNQPMGGIASARWNQDRCFLKDLYGLSYNETWISFDETNKEEAWNVFWIKLKENISINKPLIVSADPFLLPSLIKPILHHIGFDELYNVSLLMQYSPITTFHVILVVGYDETNNIIYYNDPMSAILGYPEAGIYASIPLDLFKSAILKGSVYSTIHFGSFSPSQNKSLNKNEIFIKAHARNIDKMKGNPDVYDDYLDSLSSGKYGINAVSALYENVTGLNNQLITILKYAGTNSMYVTPLYFKFAWIVDKLYPELFDMADYKALYNYYYQLSVEKHNISQYLRNVSDTYDNQDISNICLYESNLFQEESENWERLGDYYSFFMKHGMTISLMEALVVINKMKVIIEDIIRIQQDIINGPGVML